MNCRRSVIMSSSPAQAGVCAILIGCIWLPGCGGVAAAPEPAAAVVTPPADGRIVVPANSPKLNLIHVAPVSMGPFDSRR